MQETTQARQETTVGHKILTAVGVVLCVILIPILIVNCTLIAKSYLNREEVPSFGGWVSFIVLTDSMYPEIQSGDLIICHMAEAEEVEVGDVISFYDPVGNGVTVLSHRVVEVIQEDGAISFRTKGDSNNVEDQVLVPGENLVGIFSTRIPNLGNLAMFMSTTKGLLLLVVLPLVLLVGYDVLRSRRYARSQQADTDALLAELEALRAEKDRVEKGDK